MVSVIHLTKRETIYCRLAETKESLQIGIIDADLLDRGTRHPNLALMKISAWCQMQGHQTELVLSPDDIQRYDWLFMSKVFSFTKVDERFLSSEKIEIGGTGFDPEGKTSLPESVEHTRPDYELYKAWALAQIEAGYARSSVADYLDFSIGFTSRGCFRKCDFCVNKKYDHAFLHSPVSEFLDESRPYIYLWDDNVLACSQWKNILQSLKETNKPFQFRQGLDIRLMTKDRAKWLASAKYHGDYIFAFDHIEDKDLIERKLKIWREATSKGTRLYVLCAYDSQDARDIETVFERVSFLMKYACLPYVMRYENYLDSKYKSFYVTLARWCNQPRIYKKMSFRQFCEACQKYHKNKKTLCSSYRAMLEFEKENPEIAKAYFDLRYEDEIDKTLWRTNV